MNTFVLIQFILSLPLSKSTRLRNSYYSPFGNYLDQITTTPIPDYDDVNSKSRKSEILDRLLDGNNYDEKIRPPGVNGTGPTIVFIGVYLRSVENVDDVRMQFGCQMTFWQEWVDPRLKYSHIQKNIPYLQLTMVRRIWVPDVFFRNEKSGNKIILNILPNCKKIIKVKMNRISARAHRPKFLHAALPRRASSSKLPHQFGSNMLHESSGVPT